jgi:hypothetical protein
MDLFDDRSPHDSKVVPLLLDLRITVLFVCRKLCLAECPAPSQQYADPRAVTDGARQYAESLVQPNTPPQNVAANAARIV